MFSVSKSKVQKMARLRIVVWIMVVILFEVVVVLWPLACVLSGKGLSTWWSVKGELLMPGQETLQMPDRFIAGRLVGRTVFLFFLLVFTLPFDLGSGRISMDLDGFLAFVFIQWIITGVDIWFAGIIIPRIVTKTALLLIYSGISTGIFLGFYFGFVVERFLFRGFIGKLLAGSLTILLMYLLPSLILGWDVREYVFYNTIGLCFGMFMGILLARSVVYMLNQLSTGFTSTIRGFLSPWRLNNYSFRRALTSLVLVYMGVVLLFSLWFYACYMGDANSFHVKGNENIHWWDSILFFHRMEARPLRFWDFVYFSSVTITTLGYGDISPAHRLPQVLVIFETMMGVGLIAGFLGMILHVAGRGGTGKRKIDFDADIDY